MRSMLAPEFDFKNYTATRRDIVEERLQIYLEGSDPAPLWDAMRYSVLSGGKRLRALLCIAGAEAVSAKPDVIESVLPCACAIELVHAMSLIHDDLPCMDNDDLRRGKPTNHKVFGEALALLAGDALLIHANDILIDKTPADLDRHTLLCVIREFARAAGPHGMVAGQVDDLTFTGGKIETVIDSLKLSGETPPVESDASKVIETIHKRKTGALIKFSVWSGAVLANGTQLQVDGLARFGEILGLAFQITDDLLDVTSDAQTLGKTPGKDESSQKATWVRVFGIEGSKAKLEQLEKEAGELLPALSLQSSSMAALKALLQYAINRKN